MKFEELKSHISKGELRGAYILMGDDDYLILAARKMFAAKVSQPDFNYTVIPSDKPELTVNALRVFPLMSDYRIVDIACDKEISGLKEYLKNPNSSSVLLLTINKIEKFHKEILPMCELIDCNRLDERTLIRWVRSRAAERGATIDEDAASLLVSYCNRMMRRISDETEKTACYGYGKEITVRDIEALVVPDTEVKIFQLGDAVAKKNGESAIKIYRELLYFNDTSIIFGALYSHFRKLLYCIMSPKEEAAAALGIKDYALKIYVAQSKTFGALRLKKIIDGFHEIDFGIKRGTLTDKSVLEGYLLELLLS